jgi:hypothetical protein
MLNGFFSEQNFRKSLRESGYANESWQLLHENITNLLEENSILLSSEDIIDADEAYLNLTNYIDSVFAGKANTTMIAEHEQDMRSRISSYMEEYNVTLTPAAQQSLDSAIKNVRVNMERYMLPEFAERFYNFYQSYRDYFGWGFWISIVIMIVISIILLFLHHYKHRAIRYIVCAVFGAVLTNISILIFFRRGNGMEQMLTGPDFYQRFQEQYISHAIEQWYIISGVGVLITLAGICVMQAIKHKKD